MDIEKIPDVNETILKYSVSSSQYSSHEYINLPHINFDELVPDITFFKMTCENEAELDNHINDMIEELDKIGTHYTLRNEDSGELLVSINSVGALEIKFNKIKILEKGTYEKIDELKSLKNEFGTCRGFKPQFRPLEGNSIENVKINPESIYMFSNSQEDLLKLKDYLSEKVMDINPDFELKFEILK